VLIWNGGKIAGKLEDSPQRSLKWESSETETQKTFRLLTTNC